MTNKEKQLRATIAQRIKEIRTSKGMTQFDLSHATGLTQGAISQYEAGNIALNVFSLIRVCDGLGCTVDYLLGRDAEYGKDNLRGRLFQAFSKMDAGQQEMFVDILEYTVRDK